MYCTVLLKHFDAMKKLLLGLMLISSVSIAAKGQNYPYKDASLSVDERVEDLLSRMTIKEKFWQMFMIPGDLSDGKERYHEGIFGFQVATTGQQAEAAGQMLDYGPSGTAKEVAEKINGIQRFFMEESRLGIPIIPFDEALHGLVRDDATAFPQAIALAATWDTTLVGDVAQAIALETKTRGIRQILSPVLNIARDVRWGRTEETYGEDPYLTSLMAKSFIGQFERNGVITTPKHFVANVGAGGRDSYPIHFNERILEEIYFPAFKEVFTEIGARSVMTAYNSLDGTPCTSNEWLLRKKLKDEWGFDGFVISDAGATGGANVLHFTAADYAEATEDAVEGGLDVIFQTSYDHFPLFWEAYKKGMIDTSAINDAVKRVLKAKFELGLFEDPYVDPNQAAKYNNQKSHRDLARKAAAKSMVLLQNRNNVLPLKEGSEIALIGYDAKAGRLGGYSGPGNDIVTFYDGLVRRFGENSVHYAKGVPLVSSEFVPVETRYLKSEMDGESIQGLNAEYFGNINFEGDPVVKRTDKQVRFGWTLFPPDPKLEFGWYSVRWTGKLEAPETGIFNIGVKGNDGYRMWLDGELIIDNQGKTTHSTMVYPYSFEKGKTYDLKIEFFESSGRARFNLVWDYGVDQDRPKEIANAVAVAENSDVAIVAAGIHEGEFQDRGLLSLPGHQVELIKAVAATGKPTIVALFGGSAITMNNWKDQVDGILMAWYPGEVGGDALADVVSGDVNPAGRLPVTFPVHEAQCPLYYNHKPTGRGDDYYNLTGEPLFPFGYGLSYTSFEYAALEMSKSEIYAGEKVKVTCKVKNTGEVTGDEVVQLYLHDTLASVARPVKELKGFQRISLNPGEEKKVTFELGFDELSMLDKDLNRMVEPGKFRIMVGASSKDIRLREFLTVAEK